MAPLSWMRTSEALRYGTHCKGFQSLTCTPMHLSANSMNHAFPAEAGPHSTDPGGMEG